MLLEKIETKEAKLCVLGLGHVGLPLAVEFSKAGFPTLGIDIDSEKIKNIKNGRSYIVDVESSVLKEVSKKLIVGGYSILKKHKIDVVFICVPTPLRKEKDPDIGYVIDAAEKILDIIHKGMLVILESTVFPGATEEIVLKILEKSGLKVGKDFYLGFSPERIDPGNKVYTLKNTPKIVSGITEKCKEATKKIYSQIVDKVVPVSSCKTAEMVKLLENTFRAVNIGLVNEIAVICDRLNIDVWEVVEAAATKPFGYMLFYPGPGLGGHCIPVDPHYLAWKMRSLKYSTRFIQLADEINTQMVDFAVVKLSKIFNRIKKPIKNSKILVLGVTYKKDVGDIRESPAIDLIRLLIDLGAGVEYSDPYIKFLILGKKKIFSKDLNYNILKKYDCVVIVTPHLSYDYKKIVHFSKLIFDTRNATKGIISKKIFKL